MKAMIFAAGLGTRLRPLTNERPKALVEVSGKPLLWWNLMRLQLAGYTEVVVNIHHFGQQIIDFLAASHFPNLHIFLSDERDLLLDTGGGLWHARSWLQKGEDFLLCNADILTDLDLQAFRQQHLRQQGLATLAVRKRESSRYLLFDKHGLLCGWKNARSGEVRMSRPKEEDLRALAFSGYHYLSPRIFLQISERSRFSIIDLYLRLAKEQDILAYEHNDSSWLDVGKPERLEQAAELLTKMDWSSQVQDSDED